MYRMLTSKKSFLLPDKFLFGMDVFYYPVDYKRRSYDPWHHHCFDELVIVRSGEGIHDTEHKSAQIRAGDVFLIPCGFSHGYRNLRNLRIVNILFRKNKLENKFIDLAGSPGYRKLFGNETDPKEEDGGFSSQITLEEEQLRECEKIFARMKLEQSGDLPGKNCMIELLFMNLCVIICRSSSTGKAGRLQEDSDLGVLLSFMEKHHAEQWKLEDLAKQINRSVSSMTSLFRLALGTSPIEYLNTIRLEQAAKDLRDTDKSISAIAFDHGFSDSNYFSTRFSRHFGCPPKEYRARDASGKRITNKNRIP